MQSKNCRPHDPENDDSTILQKQKQTAYQSTKLRICRRLGSSNAVRASNLASKGMPVVEEKGRSRSE
jgi:hypothetical protein